MPWSTEQKMFVVEAYFRQKSIHAAQLQFKERFGCRGFPVHSIIYRWVNKFRTHGTVHNLNSKDTNRQSHSGRPKSSRTTQSVAAVRDSCPQPKQVCASAKSGGWNQQRVSAENFNRRSPHVSLQDTDWTKACTWRHEEASDHVPVVLRQDWNCARLVAGVARSGRRLHRTWTPDFYLWGYLKDRVYGNNPQTIPDLKAAITAAIRIRAIPKGGMQEGHRELCPPDPNVPAASGNSFGSHFLSASETKSFCSTDLKLWRCLLHRLDLM